MISKQDSLAIDLSRFVAMALIVSCHVLQAYGNIWAFICNVGVQMFFLLSGYLYGVKDNLEWKSFFCGRFKKIYLPYVVFLLLAFPVLLIVGMPISWKQVLCYSLNLQAFSTPIEGLNHLWFLSLLMIGYVLTPGLRFLWENYKWCLIWVLAIVCVLEYAVLQKMYSNFTWLLLFVLGLLLGMSKKSSHFWVTGIAAVGLFFTAAMLPSVDALCVPEFSHLSVWFHVSLSIVLLCILKFIAALHWPKSVISKLVCCNKISYEIYLIHHIFCLGPVSLLFLTEWPYLNIFIMLMISVLVAWLLKIISAKLLYLL